MIKHTPLLNITGLSQREDGVMFGFSIRVGRGPAMAVGFCKPWKSHQFQPKTQRVRRAIIDWGTDQGTHYFTAFYGMVRGYVSRIC